MDHKGEVAHRKSSKLVVKKIKELTNEEPAILVGDFNFDQRNENYKIFTESEFLSDSYDITRVRYALNGTFNGFDPNELSDERIDHVFVTQNITVERYGILTDTYRAYDTARIPSDHFPVSVELSIQ